MAQNIELKILASVSESLQNIQALVSTGQDAQKEFLKLGKNITKGFEDSAKSSKKLSDSVGGISAGFKGLIGVAAAAATAIAGAFTFREALNAAIEQENASNRLAGALRITGEATKENIQRFEDLATEMQRTTKFGDDLILNQVAIIKSFGSTNEQAEKIVKTAANLSAAFGVDLETATRELAGTLTGLKGRLTGRIADIAALGMESLKSGKAIDILAEKFAGFAERDAKTFQGALQGAKNAFGDLLEEIGFFVVNNQAVISGINFVKNALIELGSSTKQLREEYSGQFTQALVNTIRLFAKLGEVIGAVSEFLLKYQAIVVGLLASIPKIIGAAFGVLTSLQEKLLEVKEAIFGVNSEQAKGQREIIKNARSTQAYWDGLSEAATEYAFDIADSGTATGKFFKSAADSVDNLATKIEKTPLKLTLQEDELTKSFKNARQISDEESKKIADKIEKNFNDAVKNPFVNLVKEYIPNARAKLESFFGGLQDQSSATTLGFGQIAAKGLAAGEKGFGNIVGSLIQGVGAALGPLGQAIAGIAGPIIDLLGQSEEQVRETIRGFAEGAVTFVQNFITNIPIIISEIAKAGPAMIKKLIEGLPQVINSLAENMGVVAAELALQMPNVAHTFATSLIEQAPNIAKAIIEAIPRAGGSAVSGVGGFFKKIGFAEGGTPFVKTVRAGFPNDTFPASLSSGELIVDRSTTLDLKEFLSSQRQNQASGNGGSSRDMGDIVISIDGREVARAVRSQLKQGFAL